MRLPAGGRGQASSDQEPGTHISAATNSAAGPTAGEIDAEVRRLTGEGRHLYELDEPTLAELDVDLIVTQAVCEVCAVSYDDVMAVAIGCRPGRA